MRPVKTSDSIFFLLNKACQAGNRQWSAKVAQDGVTGVQALVLVFLLEQDQLTATALREKTAIDSATLTGVLDRLESATLVERRKKPDDRRANLICLTPGGRSLALNIRSSLADANQTFLSGLSDIEKKLFRSLLRRVCQDKS